MPTAKIDKKTMCQLTSTVGDKRSQRQEEEATDKKRWKSRQMGGGGARKGGGGNTTTSHGGHQEAAAKQLAEAPVDRRWRRDEMQRNNQPGWMRDNHTRE